MYINKGKDEYFNSHSKDKVGDKRKAFSCIYDSQELSSFMSCVIYCIFRSKVIGLLNLAKI